MKAGEGGGNLGSGVYVDRGCGGIGGVAGYGANIEFVGNKY